MKTIATNGFLTALECTKFVFGRCPSWTRWGSLQHSPRPSNWFNWALLLRGREDKGLEKKGGEQEGREGERTGNVMGCPSP